MTVLRDTKLEFATFTTTSPATLAYTPVGTPSGVTVCIAHGGTNDSITGVTYGGVALTRISSVAHVTGETGRVYHYFLGTGIPTGAQTVSIAHTGSADVKYAICQTVTAAADTEIQVFDTLAAVQANPQIALDTGATSSLRNSILWSGLDGVASLTILSGMLSIGASNSHDFGTQVALFGEQNTALIGSYTIGYTAASEDTAMIAAAIQEVGAGATGTIAATQADDVAAFAGTVLNPITGTIAANQDSQTGAFVGAETFTGTIGATQDPNLGAFSGTVANPITGTIGAVQDPNVGAFTGQAVSDGTWNSIQANQTANFNGLVANPVIGVLGATQADQVGAFAGDSTSPGVTGTLAAVQDPNVMAAAGDVIGGPVTGTLAAIQANQTAAFVGAVANPVAGAVVSVTCELGGPTVTCTISPAMAVVGSNVIVTSTFKDANGELADPASISAVAQAPDGTQTTPTPTSSSEGIWKTTIPTTQAGVWFGQISGAGDDIDVVCVFTFCVEPSLVLV